MRGDECSKLAQSDYRKRHDEVAHCVHWNLGEVRRTDIGMLDKDTGDGYHSSWRWKGRRKGNGKAREIPRPG